MIAQRFRPLGWVAGVATAATGLYLVSLQVAAERAKLETVEHRIVAAQRDMRRLQTEFSTRSSLRQLEKWNGETLSLAAPTADQYLHHEQQLASLGTARPTAEPTEPTAFMTASVSTPAASDAKPVPAVSATATPRLERAAYLKAAVALSPQRIATAAHPLLDRGTLSDVMRQAAREDSKRP